MESHQTHDGENTPLGTFLWVLGLVFFTLSKMEPSETRAWITFSLGALASLISIIINWKKFYDTISGWRKNRKHKNSKNAK
jgi:hypothetical protein